MTDRELLELAAKAAGYKIAWEGGCVTGWMTGGSWWNPLTDDGDALRLATDLGLDVYPIARTATGQACSAVGTSSRGRLAEIVDPSSTRAATRRAIVRAAAEIQRAKENNDAAR